MEMSISMSMNSTIKKNNMVNVSHVLEKSTLVLRVANMQPWSPRNDICRAYPRFLHIKPPIRVSIPQYL